MRTIWLLLMIFLLVIYLVIGGVIFKELEATREVATKRDYLAHVRDFLGNHTCITMEEFTSLVTVVIQTYDEGAFTLQQNDTGTHAEQWDLWNSIFFSTTVITTIGYGNQTPVTTGGKLFCIVYAILGIPLTVTCLAYVGDKLTAVLKRLNSTKLFKKFGDTKHAKVAKTVIFTILGIFICIFIPAFAFSSTQDWDYLTSVYYGFVTLSTIGFGDYVPNTSLGTDHTEHALKLMLLFWMLFGLSFISLVLNLMNEGLKSYGDKVMDTVEKEMHETGLCSPGRESHVNHVSTEIEQL